ncbi:MAG: SDR family oxidoreductase [Cyclobacteriaceae bacterium]|nr:SDR family oxidoreductase [Cyclobacteriaceae bacterium]
MILVTGATGHFGNAAINFLLEKGVKATEITALVRAKESAEQFTKRGIQTVVGDYDDYASLVSAFKGVDHLLFVSGSDIGKRLLQHQHVVKAAVASGVKHIVYTSFQRKNETETSPLWGVAQSHLQTEKWLKESGITYTILKNNLYMDFIPAFVGEKVSETGVIYLPAKDGKVSAALRVELAEATATILRTVSSHVNKVYDFTNSEAFTYQEVAELISAQIGKKINYVSPTADEYAQTLAKFGLPQDMIGVFAGFAVAQAVGELDVVSKDLENILGRKPTTIAEFLKSVYRA